MVKLSTGTQDRPALSTAASELYGLVRCATFTIGFCNMAADYGRTLAPRLSGDATAASGIAHRRGAGKLRHVETNTLWLQRSVTEQHIILKRVAGVDLAAALGTKHSDAKTMLKHVMALGFSYRAGKSPLGLKAQV